MYFKRAGRGSRADACRWCGSTFRRVASWPACGPTACRPPTAPGRCGSASQNGVHQMLDAAAQPLEHGLRACASFLVDHEPGTVVDVACEVEAVEESGQHLVVGSRQAPDRHLVGLGEMQHHIGNAPADATRRRRPLIGVERAQNLVQLDLLIVEGSNDLVHRAKLRRMSINSIADLVRVHGKERPDKPGDHLRRPHRHLRRSRRAIEPSRQRAVGRGRRRGRPCRHPRQEQHRVLRVALRRGKGQRGQRRRELAPRRRPRWRRSSRTPTAKVLVVGQDFVDVLDAIAADLPGVKKIVVVGGHAGYARPTTIGSTRSPRPTPASSPGPTTSASSSTRRARPVCPRA